MDLIDLRLGLARDPQYIICSTYSVQVDLIDLRFGLARDPQYIICSIYSVQVDLIDLRWGLARDPQEKDQVERCLEQVHAADYFVGKVSFFYSVKRKI